MCCKYFQQSVVLCNCLFISILQKALFCVVKQACFAMQNPLFSLCRSVYSKICMNSSWNSISFYCFMILFRLFCPSSCTKRLHTHFKFFATTKIHGCPYLPYCPCIADKYVRPTFMMCSEPQFKHSLPTNVRNEGAASPITPPTTNGCTEWQSAHDTISMVCPIKPFPS